MFVSKWFSFILLIFCGALTGAEKDGIKTISVMKGDSVTLPTGVSEINRYMQILWLFGPENPDTLVAEIYKTSISIYDSYKGLDRLQMDQQTGSLTIRNITTTHSGLYTAQIMTAMATYKRFKVIVYAPVTLPVIESSECQISVLQKCAAACFGFSCEVCTLKCSTENGPGVSLSWYIGSERLNQTSSSELNVNLSLPLEIKERNIDMYQCVAANPVSNQTTQFSFQEHCPPYTDSSHFCGFTEAVIRLVISALVGVAAVAMLVYDFRS
ncbi:hepatocyte cell adhesion molecule-like [Ctenopharyngodon idella]|uniref:hepatocyte cell adhesion molecule-like n=1 Tax=Ctenopharyngodon idella TaxID=7959 RepID=UPI00222F154E|nr:hepatocyte cell adhesion molecule-like [Ctenopharyngodon idella]